MLTEKIEFSVHHLVAGYCLYLPANDVHRVYTHENSIVIGTNFITEAGLERSVNDFKFERESLEKESHKPVPSRELFETNLFGSFEMIVMLYVWKVYNEILFTINRREQQQSIKFQMKKIINTFETTPRRKNCSICLMNKILSDLVPGYDWFSARDYFFEKA